MHHWRAFTNNTVGAYSGTELTSGLLKGHLLVTLQNLRQVPKHAHECLAKTSLAESKMFKCLSHMIFSFFNDKRLLATKYSGAYSLEVLCPFIFLIWLFNRMLHLLIFLIRFSDRINLLFSV